MTLSLAGCAWHRLWWELAQRCEKAMEESILHRFCPSSFEEFTLPCRGWIYTLKTCILSCLLSVQVAAIAREAPCCLDAAERGHVFLGCRAAQLLRAWRLSHLIHLHRELISRAWRPALPAALTVLVGVRVCLAMDPAETAALLYILGRCHFWMQGPFCRSSPPALACCLSH